MNMQLYTISVSSNYISRDPKTKLIESLFNIVIKYVLEKLDALKQFHNKYNGFFITHIIMIIVKYYFLFHTNHNS